MAQKPVIDSVLTLITITVTNTNNFQMSNQELADCSAKCAMTLSGTLH